MVTEITSDGLVVLRDTEGYYWMCRGTSADEARWVQSLGKSSKIRRSLFVGLDSNEETVRP